MAITKKMTWEESRDYKPSKKELERIKNLDNPNLSDCPEITEKQLLLGKRGYEVHPEWYKPTKKNISIRIDSDILDSMKKSGKGWQTRVNELLREAVTNGQF